MSIAAALEYLNDEDVLGDTPIGHLRVVPWGGGLAVGVMDKHEPTIVRRIVHQLSPGENPLNAIYGKRTFEGSSVWAALQRAIGQRKRREEGIRDDLAKDARIDVQKALEKSWDGGVSETLQRALGRRG